MVASNLHSAYLWLAKALPAACFSPHLGCNTADGCGAKLLTEAAAAFARAPKCRGAQALLRSSMTWRRGRRRRGRPALLRRPTTSRWTRFLRASPPSRRAAPVPWSAPLGCRLPRSPVVVFDLSCYNRSAKQFLGCDEHVRFTATSGQAATVSFTGLHWAQATSTQQYHGAIGAAAGHPAQAGRAAGGA